VGSFNLDRWSHRRNLEVTAGVLDRRMASELEEHFQEDLESSREVSLEEWNRRTLIERVGQALAYQLMRL
jgi:cardiolipin synthase